MTMCESYWPALLFNLKSGVAGGLKIRSGHLITNVLECFSKRVAAKYELTVWFGHSMRLSPALSGDQEHSGVHFQHCGKEAVQSNRT